MSMIRFLRATALGTMVVATAALAAEDKSDPLPSLPQPIPSAWLSPERHPALGVHAAGPGGHAPRIGHLTTESRHSLKDQADLAARFAKMPAESPDRLGASPKSQFVYGLGMNIDPVYKSRMRWAGWNRPFVMLDIKGNAYPNAAWPDHGDGCGRSENGRSLLLRRPGQRENHPVAGAADAAGVGRRLRPQRLAATRPGRGRACWTRLPTCIPPIAAGRWTIPPVVQL